MGPYRHPAMKQFADQQVRFAPMEHKLRQLERAEALLAQIKPDKPYPYQYVVFRITDARTEMYPDLSLTGEDLIEDLLQLIEDVSASAEISPQEVGEPVLTVVQLSKKYSISTKTVNRWRERGLVSRRFMVEGRLRVGFLESSVNRFVDSHQQEVVRGSRFTQMSPAERDKMVEDAREMARSVTATLAEIARRLGESTGRSPETIRYTIRKFDLDHPEHAVFPNLRGQLDDEQRKHMYKIFRDGAKIATLARRYGRERSSIYRILTDVRARELSERTIESMHHPSFDEADADAKIVDAPEPTPTKATFAAKPPGGLPPYLHSLYEVPLLSREQEACLFRKMNYLLYSANRRLDVVRANPERASSGELDEIEKREKAGVEIKRRLIRANLRLVVSIAKKHIKGTTSLFDLISDGNVSLMRAVEKFDFGRGFKFSTYASWAIMKNFARSIPAENTHRDRFITGQELAFDLKADERSVESEVEQQKGRLVDAVVRMLNHLDEREREIIMDRYGLADRSTSQTLEEVGQRWGVTKERIRQIEARAIRKLKEYAVEEKLDSSIFG